jgi:glycosyltransferase involved in cell wall biosynthesis
LANGLRLLIVTPSYLPDVTGNAITAHRLYKGLTDKGIEVQVSVGAIHELPLQFKPDIIHALHALKGGVPAMGMAERFGIPFVVTITGTDLNIDLLQSEDPQILKVFDRAARIITYSPLSKDRLLSRLPSISEKTTIIRPSIDVGKPKGDRSILPSGFNFLLPSGIRRVKDPSFAIRPLEVLRKEFQSINLAIAGPVLDETEWKNLSDLIKGKDWVYYRKVSHDEMPDIFDSADVVINTSVSEGLSNAILEAMSLGKAVLASDCDGNRAVISDGVDGLLYGQGDEDGFMRKAKSLILDAGLRERLRMAAREKVNRDYSLDAEMEGHMRLYREVLHG